MAEDKSFYVYGIFNKDWNEYCYIGKGCRNRYKQFAGRSEILQKVLDRYDCESRILLSDLTEEDAYKKECEIKVSLILDGRPILDFESKSINKIKQREGIKIAKEKGKHLGRPKADYPINWGQVYAEWKNGEITAKVAMEKLDLKRTTFYKLVGTHENKCE